MRTTTKKKNVFLFIYRKETEPDSSFVTPNFMDGKKTGLETETDLYISFIFYFFLLFKFSERGMKRETESRKRWREGGEERQSRQADKS